MLTLISHSPSIASAEWIRAKIKSFLPKKGGPYAVERSLVSGLRELKIPFELNPTIFNKNESRDTVHIISGIEALKWAIESKKLGKIKKLIAGPTLVVSPLDHNKILTSPEIDVILCPSMWVKNYYESKIPECKDKIKVWYAGVEIPNTKINDSRSSHHGLKCLIYDKNPEYNNISRIEEICKKNNVKSETFNYGSFKNSKYLNTLANSDFMIYIGKSESQGIALNEAWIRNVPTLVFNNKVWTNDTDTWEDPKISSPYLDDTTGTFFTEDDNLEIVIPNFIEKLTKYRPQDTSLKLYTDKTTTLSYLSIIDEKYEKTN